ncbi:MAG TPA: hypothetical protein PLA23_11690 [Methanospirillum sp.]|nr:hypothetical protein [Methanospirillum sp.]
MHTPHTYPSGMPSSPEDNYKTRRDMTGSGREIQTPHPALPAQLSA